MEKAQNLIANIPEDFPKDQPVPVFMLNLLQFHEQAKYPPGSKYAPCSGQEAWVVRYVTEFRKVAANVGGLELVYLGIPASMIVGEESEK